MLRSSLTYDALTRHWFKFHHDTKRDTGRNPALLDRDDKCQSICFDKN